MAICGVELDPATAAALGGFALAIASELIAASPLRENGVIQLVLSVARRFVPVSSHTPSRKEVQPAKSNQEPRRSSTRRRSSKPSSSSEPKRASK